MVNKILVKMKKVPFIFTLTMKGIFGQLNTCQVGGEINYELKKITKVQDR